MEGILESITDKPLTGFLSVELYFYPPDNRRRDIDNVQKCLLDSLEKGGLLADDYQIKRLLSERLEKVKDGRVDVKIKPYEER